MAVNAVFLADFTKFNASVQGAEVTLKGFDGAIKTVDKDLAKLGNQFSGQKIFKDVTLIEKAVSDLGGATRLTAAEQARVNATVTEALEKYRRLGDEAKKAIGKDTVQQWTDLKNATDKATTGNQTFMSSLKDVNSILGAFGLSLGINALVGFGRELLRTGDELVRVADRTGLTTDEVQRLQYIAGQSGNSLDEMTSAVGRLQNGLVTGDKSAVAAVKALGLNLESLRAATPFEQMEQIATAIGKIPDPASRAAIAMDLFGRGGIAILPTLTAEFEKLGNQAPVMSDKTVRALDAAGDSFARFGAVIKVWAAESYNFAGKAFDRLVAFAFDAAAAITNMTASITEMISRLPGGARVLDALGISTDGLRKQAQFFTDAAKAQRIQIEAVGVAVRKTATGVFEYTGAQASAAKATDEGAKAAERSAKAIEAFRLKVDEASFSLRRLAGDVGNVPATISSMNVSLSDAATTLQSYRLETEKLITAVPALNAHIERTGGVVENASQHVMQASGVFSQFSATLKTSLGGLNDIFQSAFEGGGGLIGAVKSFATNVTSNLLGMIPMVGPILSKFGGAVVAGISKLFGGIFGKSEGRKQLDAANADIKKLQDELLKTYGSIENIRQAGGAAGDALAEAWGSQNVKGLEHFQTLLETFNTDIEDAKHFTESLASVLDEVAASGQLASKELLGMIAQLDAAGQATEEINKFVSQSATSGVNGLARFLQTGADALERFSKGGKDAAAAQDILRATLITSQASATAFGSAIAGAFGELQARGMSITEALAAVAPAVQALEAQLTATGLNGGAAFDQLRQFVSIAKDEITGPAIDAVAGLSEAFTGLHNSGLLTQDIFAGLGAQVAQTFEALTKQGVEGESALRLMQPTLQKIWQLQQDFGYTVDENTQRMLDQAQAAGVVGDVHRSASDKMARGIERLVNLMEVFLRQMGVEVPNATKAAAGAHETAAEIARDGWTRVEMAVEGVRETLADPSGPQLFAENIVTATEVAGAAVDGLKSNIMAGVTMPIDFSFGSLSRSGGGSGGGGGSGYLTQDEANERGVAYIDRSHFPDDTDSGGYKSGAGYGDGFARGTGGQYLDFGTGTPVTLHGKERVMTEAEGQAEAEGLSAIYSALCSIERLLREQPRQTGIALQTALVYGGARG